MSKISLTLDKKYPLGYKQAKGKNLVEPKPLKWVGSSREDLNTFPKEVCKDSSGNVFEDLGISNPEEALSKAKIVSQIHRIVKKRRLTQAKIAKLLKITQPKVSLLLRGYLKNFSLERLFRFLNDLGQDVYIAVAPSQGSRQGHTCISYSPAIRQVAALGR